MKKVLDTAEKARRQDWRDANYNKQVVTPAHHLTKQQRRDIANTSTKKANTMDAAGYFDLLFSPKEMVAKPVPVKYLKMRARKRITKHTEEHANLQDS
jgi:hypothetical protein